MNTREPRPAAWRQVNAQGEAIGPLSRVHSVFTVKYPIHPVFNPNGEKLDEDVTCCGLPIQGAFTPPFGVYSSRGPVEVVDLAEEDIDRRRLCKTCFPVIRTKELGGASLFGQLGGDMGSGSDPQEG